MPMSICTMFVCLFYGERKAGDTNNVSSALRKSLCAIYFLVVNQAYFKLKAGLGLKWRAKLKGEGPQFWRQVIDI